MGDSGTCFGNRGGDPAFLTPNIRALSRLGGPG